VLTTCQRKFAVASADNIEAGLLMKLRLSVAAIAVLIGVATTAQAAVIASVKSQGFDQSVGTPSFDFEGASALSNSFGTFTGTGVLRTGTKSDAAAPAGDKTQYLSIMANKSETLDPTKAFTEMQLYVGSIDNYNSFTFVSGGMSQTVTGTQLLSMGTPSLSPASGNQSNALNNRFFDIWFSAPVTSVIFSSKNNSLEFDNVNLLGGVPEPGIWALFITGFGLLGAAVRSRQLSPFARGA
jgi:hypothetical protein